MLRLLFVGTSRRAGTETTALGELALAPRQRGDRLQPLRLRLRDHVGNLLRDSLDAHLFRDVDSMHPASDRVGIDTYAIIY